FLVPFERNPMFQGRDLLLLQIKEELFQNKPKRYNHRLAIHGLGGVGKTQIALEYTYQHRTSYDYIFWVHGAECASLISDLALIARKTNCIDVKDESQLEVIAAEVLKWLSEKGG